MLRTNRGTDSCHIRKYEIFDKLFKQYEDLSFLFGVNLSAIEKVIIIGHGIKADQTLLEEILKSCINLKRIVLYRYNGEPSFEIERKNVFLRSVCCNTTIVMENLLKNY